MKKILEKFPISLIRISSRDVFIFAFFVIFCFYAFPEVLGRLGYELQEIANWDTGLYYTVGKGIANGIPPYSGLYENKPPLIFLISAISYKLSDGFYLVNVFNVFQFLIILFAPAITFSIIAYKKKSRSSAFAAVASFAISSIFMCYTELRSGEVQIEAFGAAALLLMFCSMTFTYNRDVKFYDKTVIASGVFLGIAAMFKEPFGFIGAVSLLFFIRAPRDLITKFLFPILYASILSLAVILCSGGIIPYFTVYLSNMFGAHITVHGSPFERARNIFRLFDDLRNYSRCLEAFVISLIALNGIICTSALPNSSSLRKYAYPAFKTARLLLLLWAASFTVGLSGVYYNHHHIFALPCYAVLFFSLYCETFQAEENSDSREIIKKIWFPLAICSLALATINFYNREPYEPNSDVPVAVKNAKENALYVDKILDALHEDRYQYLGFNGHEFYAYTRHLPIGPSFAQWPNNFKSEDSYFAKEFIKQLKQANVIILRNYNVGVHNDKTKAVVQNCFSPRTPKAAQDIERPESFRYTILFRTVKDCPYLD